MLPEEEGPCELATTHRLPTTLPGDSAFPAMDAARLTLSCHGGSCDFVDRSRDQGFGRNATIASAQRMPQHNSCLGRGVADVNPRHKTTAFGCLP
jgi:hypothetical protein